ncbi:hypothetical protein [Pelomonas cellulosilytica]|uniref:Uncharacterized protein n=1 Tax=Pelomonas cellulosilytica TaxID=2906762 RepID=A0ABS8Y1Z7_9BURK|nr:hypothetical protein [Pelomonas sp. P8]MCE4557142.1 hypothetical protein [Pelomonas sp. P8]
MRTLLRPVVIALTLLASGLAAAAPITKLGVMSVLGRELELVIRAPTTGTRVDRNARETVKMAPGDFENFVLRTTADSARREGLGDAVLLARPADGSMPWKRDGQAVLVTQALLDAARAAKLSHLVLIQPARAEAKLQMYRSMTGAGQLEGLGFYIDTMVTVERADSNEVGEGFLAPYAYFDVYLVDVATLDLQAAHLARASIALADPGHQGTDPWKALSSERKVEVVRHLIQTEVQAAVHEWVQPAPTSTR